MRSPNSSAMAASGSARLGRRGRHDEIKVTEVAADEAGPVLKHYFERIKIVRPYFDAVEGAEVDAFVAEADRHPVFRIEQ